MFNAIRLLTIFFMLASCAHQEQAPDKSPRQKRGELYYSHGTAKLMSKDYTEALELLLKAQQDLPKDSRIQNNLGMAYYFKNRKNIAVKHLNKALDLDEENSDARNNLASILLEKNQLEQAQAQYEEILNDLVYPHQHRVRYNLALIHLKRGERGKALPLLKQAVKDKADYCPANFQLGQLYEQSYKYQEALEWYVKASDGTCHGEAAPQFRQAEVLAAMNLFGKAKLKYETVIELFPESPYAGISKKRLNEITRTQAVSKNRLSKPKPSKKISTPSF